MIPFLKLVARAYASRFDSMELSDICFVFPNKRSASFFTRYLDEELSGKPHFEPEAITISDFVASFSQLGEATRHEQLFTLYNEYKRLEPGVTDFDRFIFWGEMILSDYNDVDRYLINPDDLFSNLSHLREISANYLSDEQRELIRRYWGEEPEPENIERFWQHVGEDSENHKHRHKFVKLWKVLAPLYHAFTDALSSRGLASQGMFYRNAARMVAEGEGLTALRYVFVGFNVLSTAEIKIFERLKARGLADFYWDYNSPAFELKNNRASHFLAANIEQFPSLYDIGEEKITALPEITIKAMPSNVVQADEAGRSLAGYLAEGFMADPDNAINTAVVLADESMLLPVINAVPPEFTTMNITMGYPLRYTPVASLIHNIVNLRRNVRYSNGRSMFYFENVKSVISDPALMAIAPDECDGLMKLMTDKRLYLVSETEISQSFPLLAGIFRTVAKPDDLDEVFGYVRNIVGMLLQHIASGPEASVELSPAELGEDEADIPPVNDDTTVMTLERCFLEAYLDAVNDLYVSCREYGITLRETTLFQLIDRVVSTTSVRFTGEPLRGLQVMGVLETRALDFDNVVMVSVNESIFPKRHQARSFIPETLRKGYGMATIDFQESIFAYYFYRLLSRASHVTLLYDSRSEGLNRSNEPSRYLRQLIYLLGDKGNITFLKNNFPMAAFINETISISKSPAIMEKLAAFTREGSGKNLSASAINLYLNCPLCFYLEYVEGLRFPDEVTDYMDSSTFGTILHDSAQAIYGKLRERVGTHPVTAEDLLGIVKSPVTLSKVVTMEINDHFNRLGPDRLDELVGEAKVIHDVMVFYLKELLKGDAALHTPMHLVGEEVPLAMRLKVDDELTVNIRQRIDRVDSVDGVLRIVDYKTGNDSNTASSVEDLFTPSSKRPKAILQLLFYCMLYNMDTGVDRPIRPMLYKFRDIANPETALAGVKIAKESISDYHTVVEEFRQRLLDTIREIFNPEVPFKASDDNASCTFCKFKQICRREE